MQHCRMCHVLKITVRVDDIDEPQLTFLFQSKHASECADISDIGVQNVLLKRGMLPGGFD